MKKTSVVEIRNLNKYYGKLHVLKNVSFDIYENEIVGFIGPNGAGKSTTMKCICNLIFPTSGSIKVCGFDLKTEREKALGMQASLIESPGLYPTMSGLENLKLFASLRKVSEERVDELVKFTNLGRKIHLATSKYSMGMKQRLALAIVLLSKPRFIILDEPTNGLDPKGIMELRNTLRDLVEKEHLSILFSSHQLGEIEKLADRIICINKGEIIPTPTIFGERFSYHLQLSDGSSAKNIFSKIDGLIRVEELDQQNYKVVLKDETILSTILAQFLNERVQILDIGKESFDIETIYQEIYGGTL